MDPGEGMATHPSILAWEIPWTEEPGGLQSMGSQRVGATNFINIVERGNEGIQLKSLLTESCPQRPTLGVFGSYQNQGIQGGLGPRWSHPAGGHPSLELCGYWCPLTVETATGPSGFVRRI